MSWSLFLVEENEMKNMDIYHTLKNIYNVLEDDASRMTFLKRLEYSLSGKEEAIFELVDAEIERLQYRMTG